MSALVPARADESLAHSVPASVGLFLELRAAEDLLIPLVEPQVWLTLAELAGQPAALKETEQWRRRVEQTVKMSPIEAIRTLFSRRVAFVGEGLRNTQDAVIVCRPLGKKRELIRRWQARPLPTAGRTAVYRLPYNIGLGVRSDLLIFGDPATRGMFDQILAHLESRDSVALADDAVYRRLLARVPANPDGVFFVRLTPPTPATTPAVTQPARQSRARRVRPPLPELPRLLRGSTNVLLALHREDRLLHISAVGDAPGTAPVRDGSPCELVANLPRQTLLAWAGHVDYANLTEAAKALPERSIFRVAYHLQERAGTIQRLTAALKSTTCVAVGSVTPTGRQVAAPPVPALAILVATGDHQAAVAEWRDLFHSSVAIYKLLSLKLAAPPRLPPIETITIAGLEAEQLDLSALVSEIPEQTPLGELHMSWVQDGDVLIIASHSDWLRQILEARHGDARRLSGVLDLSRHPPSGQQETVFVAQTGPLADLGRLWLRYFETAAPYVLREDWWRNYQPGGANVRLGIQVTMDPQRRRLRVRSVTPNTPADGILKPGDEIIGCHPRRFATSQPVREIRGGVARRPNARWIDLLVEREQVVLVRRIPVPFVDPVEILRRVVAVGRVAQRVVYFDDVADAAGSRGYLTLELRSGREPLFDFPAVAKPADSRPE